jgi:flagellar hook-length control protein FliK
MNVSAITMKNLIGIKPTAESSSGAVTGSSTTVSTPALFMLMLLQQCSNPVQVKATAMDSKVGTLEPAMSFFGEIAAAQADTSNATTSLTSGKAIVGQKNLDTVIGTVEEASANASLTSIATASEGIASLVNTIQNTNTTLATDNSQLFTAQLNSPSPATGSPKLFTTQSISTLPRTETVAQTGVEKTIVPIVITDMKTIPTELVSANVVANTVSHSKKTQTTSESVSKNAEEAVVVIPTGENTTIIASPVDTVIAANSASVNFMKPVKEQSSSGNQKSAIKDSEDNVVRTENVPAVAQELQTTVTTVQAVSQGDLNSQGKSSSQKSDEKTDSNNTTVTAAESSSTSSWSETLKTQTEAQRTTTSALHSSASSGVTSKVHTDQTISGVHATKTGQDTSGVAKMPDALLDQVVNSVAVQVHDKSSQMRILLQPESLGEVFVKVKVDDGKVNAEIEVVNPTTKVILESNLGQLRESLSARGVDMQHIEIVASNQTGLGTSDGRSETHGQKSKRSFYNDTEDVSE